MSIPASPSGRRRAALFAAAGALLVGPPGCSRHEATAPNAGAKRPDAVDAQTIRVQRRDIQMQVIQPGTIQAFEATPVYARINGYVDKYSVNIGDRVKLGDVLLTMWIPDLVETVNQKVAAVDRA